MDVLKETEKKKESSSVALSKIRNLLQEVIYYGDTPLHFSIRYERYDYAKHIITILAADPSLKTIIDMKNSCGKVSFIP